MTIRHVVLPVFFVTTPLLLRNRPAPVQTSMCEEFSVLLTRTRYHTRFSSEFLDIQNNLEIKRPLLRFCSFLVYETTQ